MKRIHISIALAMLLLILLPISAQAAEYLIPGGQVIGLQLENDTVTIAAFDDSLGTNAKRAGLQVGDELLTINSIPIRSPEDIRSALSHPDAAANLTIRRKGRQHSLQVRPEPTADGPKLGIFLKQGITGIGTVTWYDPQTSVFGTLGHGVHDSRGKLASMTRGSAFHAQILSIKKGACGEPGQLKGSAESFTPWGSLTRNTSCGLFGTISESFPGEPIPVAHFGDITTGSAVIRCAVKNNRVQEYSVEILKIYPQTRTDGRHFLLKVTDPELLTATGGIVQGMSGSPVLQDGKIIGAVTHVLVNDPTTGYGIFIENMLDAAS